MKCTDLLIQDHKVILRCLNVLQQMAACVEKGEPPAEEPGNLPSRRRGLN